MSISSHILVVVITLESSAHGAWLHRRSLDRAECIRLVQLLNHFLLSLVRSLQLLEKGLLLVLKFTGYALSSIRHVKSRLDPARVVIRVAVISRISTHLGIEFGLKLFIFDALVGSLLLLKMVISIDLDDISDLLLLVLDFGECATVAPLEVVTLHVDRVFGAGSHLVKARTIHLFSLLISNLMSMHRFHFLLLDDVHVLHEVLSTLQVFDSFVGALLFLEQLDNSRFDGALLVLYLPLMNHSLHHVSLGS